MEEEGDDEEEEEWKLGLPMNPCQWKIDNALLVCEWNFQPLYDYALKSKNSRYHASFKIDERDLLLHSFHTVIFNKVFLGKKYNPNHEFTI